jgi:hypothetical protein
MALQSGAFLSDWNHSKYDPSKPQICSHCLVPNTQQHWFECPKFEHIRDEMMEPFNWIHEVPDCALSHLLMPRSPYEVEMKATGGHHWQLSLYTRRGFATCVF